MTCAWTGICIFGHLPNRKIRSSEIGFCECVRMLFRSLQHSPDSRVGLVQQTDSSCGGFAGRGVDCVLPPPGPVASCCPGLFFSRLVRILASCRHNGAVSGTTRFVPILLFLSAMCGEAFADDRTWWDRSTEAVIGQYRIRTDLPAEETRTLGQHLNLMHDEFARRLNDAFGAPRNEGPMSVLIFRSRDDYLYTLGARFNIHARGTGGMFFVKPDTAPAGVLALWIEHLPRQRVLHVLQHEAFHQFAYRQVGPDLPVWVNEGLAEYFGTAIVVNGKVITGQAPSRSVETVREAVQQAAHVPFRRMLAMTQHDWSGSIARAEDGGSATPIRQYTQAWSMVQFLIHAEGGRYTGDFERYLRLLRDGTTSADAFANVFGEEAIDAFEARWRQYAIDAEPSAFITALERIEFLAEGTLELLRRGKRVQTLESLREHLRDIAFSQTLHHHGLPIVLRADDDAMFKIPSDREAAAQFEMRPQLSRRMNRRERAQEEADPTPLSIIASPVKPFAIEVRWVRQEASPPTKFGWRYEIHFR